ARAAPRRRPPLLSRPRSAELRLTGRAAARAPCASPRRGRGDHDEERCATAPPARRRALGARSCAPQAPRGTRAGCRPGAHHRDRRRDAAGRAGPAPRGDAGSCDLMEPVGEGIREELRRLGADSSAAPDQNDAWLAAVGPEIARNAWPARTQADGTLV